VRRPVLIGLGACALAASGLLAALAPTGEAQSPPSTTATLSTETTTTAPETATTAPETSTEAPPTTPTTTRPRRHAKPKPTRLPLGVTIGGIQVGGLSPTAAYLVVRAAFRSPLILTAGVHRAVVSPARLGAIAYAKAAIAHARSAPEGTAVPLGISIHGRAVRTFVDSLAKRYTRDPIDAKLFLRNLTPYVTTGKPGKTLDRKRAVAAILRALRGNRRTGIVLPYRRVPQTISRDDFGPVIVIRRGSNHLFVYRGMTPWRTFVVATGQAVYPTPLGRFQIVVKWRDPWWYPPDSPWAAGAKPIPPGPGNPLGTRWMGLSAPGVGIHGTPDAASLGYSASHGCIRMYIPQAEWLFEHVDIGTTVYIVAA
jgi:lipoprotein-anchoring transpeptidase ErfK/SrfK